MSEMAPTNDGDVKSSAVWETFGEFGNVSKFKATRSSRVIRGEDGEYEHDVLVCSEHFDRNPWDSHHPTDFSETLVHESCVEQASNLQQIGAKGPPGSRDKSPEASSSTSGPSFVRINSSDAVSSTSGLSDVNAGSSHVVQPVSLVNLLELFSML